MTSPAMKGHPVKRLVMLPSALLVLAVLAGCAPAQPSPAVSSSSAPSAAGPAGISPSPVGTIRETRPQAPAESAVPVPATHAAAKDAARAVAVQAMILFARPGVEPGRWLEELRPVATAEFMKDNAAVNPRFVGASSVREAGDWVMDPANLYTVQVPVTTDGGVFTVQLHRNGAQAPWLVRYIIPPTLRGSQWGPASPPPQQAEQHTSCTTTE